MKLSYKKGLGFGLSSGVITTLGLIVGLDTSTHSSSLVIGGILIIAFADAFSDAFGIHISEESRLEVIQRAIWEATISTFIFKVLFALTFVLPFLLLPLSTALIISIIWAVLLVAGFQLLFGKKRENNAL